MTKKKFSIAALILLPILIIFAWILQENDSSSFFSEEPDQLVVPLGLPPIPWPSDNPYSRKKAALGRLLYFDKRLSSDGTISCASCHTLRRGFADPNQISQGIEGRIGTRHAPTVINAAYQTHLFWDGRAATLEEQCKAPIGNPNEMTLLENTHEAHRQCQEHIQAIKGYRRLFMEVFGDDSCSIDEIAKAISTFERTVLSGNSAFDRYKAGDKAALTKQQIEGYKVYLTKGCRNCHGGPLFTDGRFTNIGIGMDNLNPDVGRFDVTHEEKDWGAFKIPTLREVFYTYDYMHDGSLKSLEEVIEYYNHGGIPNHNLHPLLHPLRLTDEEKNNLLSFLFALNGEGWHHFTEPASFPK